MAGPVRGEEEGGGCDHEPGKADIAEEPGVYQIKGGESDEGDEPGSAPEEAGQGKQVYGQCPPGNDIGQPRLGEETPGGDERASDGDIGATGEPAPNGVAGHPVGVHHGYGGEEDDEKYLAAEKPEGPGGDGLGAQTGFQPHIDGEDSVGGKENHERAEQQDEVAVVLIQGLIEEEEVGICQHEKGHAQAIKQADQDEKGQAAEDEEMDEHSVSRPGFYPGEAGVGEME